MADSFVQPPANTGVGPQIDTTSLTVSAQTVQRQRINIADPSAAAGLAGVVQLNSDAVAATAYGLQVQSANQVYDGTNWERTRQAVGAPGVTVVNTEGTKATYSLAGAVSLAATPSDVVILNGSVSKTIRVTRVEVSIGATAAGFADVVLIKRSAANTSGSSTTPTPVPNDANDAAASAVVTVYTGNPTPGAAVGNVRWVKMGITAADQVVTQTWHFGQANDKDIVLRGVAQGLAINLNGDALLSGEVFSYSIEWTEE